MLNVLVTQNDERFLIWAKLRNEELNCSFNLEKAYAKNITINNVILLWDIQFAYYIYTNEIGEKIIINPDGYQVDKYDLIDNMPDVSSLLTALNYSTDY